MIVALLSVAVFAAAPNICIDPGHPSEVGRGTAGLKTTELDVVWEVGQQLRQTLLDKGYRVVMTKSEREEMVRNRERAEIANRANADLMVRLHCDASVEGGFAVYYPTKTGTSQGVTGPSQEVLDRSEVAARLFHSAFSRALKGKLEDNGLRSDTRTAVGARQGALTGSIFSKVPVLLVEMVVLTNRKDEAFIISRSGRRAMVDALAAGVMAAVPYRVRN